MAQVNILIPAYKKEFLPSTLLSAMRQSWPDLAILVSDDSPGDEATRELRGLTFPRDVRFYTGPKCGGMTNIGSLAARLDEDCRYVHVLCDDDLVFPGFIETHVRMLELSPASVCSASARWLVNDQGEIFGEFPRPAPVRDNRERVFQVAASFLFNSTIPTVENWLGEFSNVVWRREFAHTLKDRSADSICYAGLEDIGQILRASLVAPIVYLNQHLGAFRLHAAQNTQNSRSRTLMAGYLAWGGLAQLGRRAGLISIEQADRCLGIVSERVRAAYGEDAEVAPYVAYVRGATAERRLQLFEQAWRDFLSRPLEG